MGFLVLLLMMCVRSIGSVVVAVMMIMLMILWMRVMTIMIIVRVRILRIGDRTSGSISSFLLMRLLLVFLWLLRIHLLCLSFNRGNLLLRNTGRSHCNWFFGSGLCFGIAKYRNFFKYLS
jgi:hypothetical protein